MSKSWSFLHVVFVGSLVACGPANRNGNGTGDGGGGVDSNGSNGSNGSACATSMTKAEQTPLDIMVMLDQSSSMTDSVAGGGDKWTAVTGALTAFVNQQGLSHVGVGIQYFGLPTGGSNACHSFTCHVNADCGGSACGPCFGAGSANPGVCLGTISSGGDSCNAADYSGAAVEIAPLPGVGSAIIASMGTHKPTTSTPTSAALQGVIDHAQAWATAHAGDTVVAVLATDGDPTECDTDLGHIDAIAMGAATSSPKVLTFVIGVGPSLSSLDGIAAAGGTGSAFLVDTGGNVNQQFLAAMNAIQHTALGCQYAIPVPTSGAPNYGEVNVNYTPGTGGSAQTFPYVTDAAHCPASGDGWYYDNAAAPTQIILCSSTCTKVSADTSGEVDVALGCATVIQ